MFFGLVVDTITCVAEWTGVQAKCDMQIGKLAVRFTHLRDCGNPEIRSIQNQSH